MDVLKSFTFWIFGTAAIQGPRLCSRPVGVGASVWEIVKNKLKKTPMQFAASDIGLSPHAALIDVLCDLPVYWLYYSGPGVSCGLSQKMAMIDKHTSVFRAKKFCPIDVLNNGTHLWLVSFIYFGQQWVSYLSIWFVFTCETICMRKVNKNKTIDCPF